MAINLSSDVTQVLYLSRVCEQKNFDVVVSGTTKVLQHSEEKVSLRTSLKEFDKVKKVYHSQRHTKEERTICERSNVWTVC